MCTQCLCIVLAQCHSAAKRRGLLPFGGRFGAEIFVQNFKWRVSQRGADVSYILIQLLLLYLKNLLSYTAWHKYFQAFFAVQILPIHIFIMRVYTIRPNFPMTGVSERGRRKLILIQLLLLYLKNLLSYAWYKYFQAFFAVQILPIHIFIKPLYSTCSVSQRCKETRAILPFGGRFVAEIFVQNFKWRVSQRGADVSYILIQLLLLYLKNLLSYTAWHNYFQALFLLFKSFPATYL